jgi:putative PEP-CTERM system TPR-repeat lipoprotein
MAICPSVAFKYKKNLAVLTIAMCALSAGQTRAAVPAAANAYAQFPPEVGKLLEDSDKALGAGNVNLALIDIKNAVRLAPKDGTVRTRLASLILFTGQAVAAEREIRQALLDNAPSELAVPILLRAMLQRNEFNELLAEFPDPPQQTQDKLAPEILQGRAAAFQGSGRLPEARAAIDHALRLRRDGVGLVISGRLALQERNLTRANSDTEEALKLSATDEQALMLSILTARQSGDVQKELANADEYVRRVPKSTVGKVLRIEVLLDMKQTARAQQEVDVLLKETPNSLYGRYFRGVLLAQGKDFKAAWRELLPLPQEFVQSEPNIAIMVASIAASNGNAETAGAILTALVARHPEIQQARLQLAAIRLGQGSPQAAIEALAPLKTGNDPLVHALLGQAYLRLRKYDDAMASLQIASASPNASELLKRQLALSQLQVGESNQAIQGFRDLLKRDPGNTSLAAPLMAALIGTQKWDEALSVADALAKQLPKSPLPVFYRGQVFLARSNLTDAAAAFDSALALDPKFTPARYFHANVSVSRGDFENAKKDLQTVIAQDPKSLLAYVGLAQIAIDNGQNQEAVTLLEQATKAVPNDPTPRLALANYQISQRKFQDAQTTVNELLQVSRNNPEGIALQGQLQLLLGQTADGIKTFRSLAANTASPNAYSLLSRALYATKDPAGAEDADKKAIELSPQSAQLRMELINMQIAGGKPELALATARAYGSTYPGSVADLLLADTLMRLKRGKEAETVLDKSLSTKPTASTALKSAQLSLTLGNPKKATATLANWVAKNPNDYALRREYAGFIMTAGDLAGARKEYEILVKQHPEDPIVLNNLGYLIQKDNPERALSLLALAVKIAPRSPQIADTLGWIKYQRRDHQGALPLLQRAHTADANSAPIAYHLALVLDATGKRAEAKTLLQSTLARTPKFDGSDDARQVLARW